MLSQQATVRAADFVERLLGQPEVGNDVAILMIFLDLDIAEHGDFPFPVLMADATTCVAARSKASHRSRAPRHLG
jgi:hypothetical protein